MHLPRSFNYYQRLFFTFWSFFFFGSGGLLIGVTVFPAIYVLPIPGRWKIYCSRRFTQLTFRCFIGFMKHTGVLTYEICGAEKLRSRDNLLIIANHPTLIDVVFLFAMAERPNCVIKKGVWNNPFMYFVVRASGFIRNSGDAEEMVERCVGVLERGEGLLIFPEGTRTDARKEMKFRRGVAHIALAAKKSFTPVVVKCSPITLTKQHRWYNIPDTIAPHFSIAVEDDVTLCEGFGDNDSKMLKARRMTGNMERYFKERV